MLPFFHIFRPIHTLFHSGNILKPSLDLVLFTSQLSRSLGFRGTVLLFVNYYATVAILRAVTPAFGRLAATEAKLEGEYRAGMGRLARESEEIAYVSVVFIISRNIASRMGLDFMTEASASAKSSLAHICG